jgi:uncharacterized protein YigE (DUF2233 family)
MRSLTRRQLLAMAVALPWLLACERAAAAPPLRWQQGPAGLEHAIASTRSEQGRPAVAVHLLRIDPRRHELVVVPAAALGRTLASAADFRSHVGGLAAINGGYFDPQYRPLGLLVSRGRELSHLRKVDHGIFAIAAGRPLLEHARTWHAPPDLEFAVECGPRLLIGGQSPHFRRDDLARRVAIGKDRAGRVVWAVTEGVMQLTEFARLLASAPQNGGPALTDALNLDGGSSAMFDLAAAPLQARVSSAVEVPIGLAVVPRRP